MPSARRSGAAALNVDLVLEDIDLPEFRVWYLNNTRVRITYTNPDCLPKTWPIIPKPKNASECKLEREMMCGADFDEPHDTYLNIRAATRRNLNALTGGRAILYNELTDINQHTILTSVQSEYEYLFRFPGNWAGREMLRRICCNKRDTIANKSNRVKGTRRGGPGGRHNCTGDSGSSINANGRLEVDSEHASNEPQADKNPIKSTANDKPVDDKLPADDKPLTNDKPVDDKLPVNDELPANNKLPADNELPVDDKPVDNELPADNEPPANGKPVDDKSFDNNKPAADDGSVDDKEPQATESKNACARQLQGTRTAPVRHVLSFKCAAPTPAAIKVASAASRISTSNAPKSIAPASTSTGIKSRPAPTLKPLAAKPGTGKSTHSVTPPAPVPAADASVPKSIANKTSASTNPSTSATKRRIQDLPPGASAPIQKKLKAGVGSAAVASNNGKKRKANNLDAGSVPIPAQRPRMQPVPVSEPSKPSLATKGLPPPVATRAAKAELINNAEGISTPARMTTRSKRKAT
ncbi:hypothetical protein RHS04_03868 [Rhizoctonia solani]|uniref:Uncharacterized protein n=1 Tax=Rhizoctonia solani TaxID=456999 RepID=A0A8H7H907_9AGAM|nr:hypothetical protein RHS04_03868 [Rhizoctonia solani]